MHLRILQERPDINAVVHAHPVTASAFSASTTPIRCDLLSEGYAILGKVLVAPYALTASDELAENVAQIARETDCLLMRNHGVVALGKTLLQAFDRLEVIEIAAQTTLITQQIEGVRPMTPEQLAEVATLMGRQE